MSGDRPRTVISCSEEFGWRRLAWRRLSSWSEEVKVEFDEVVVAVTFDVVENLVTSSRLTSCNALKTSAAVNGGWVW